MISILKPYLSVPKCAVPKSSVSTQCNLFLKYTKDFGVQVAFEKRSACRCGIKEDLNFYVSTGKARTANKYCQSSTIQRCSVASQAPDVGPRHPLIDITVYLLKSMPEFNELLYHVCEEFIYIFSSSFEQTISGCPEVTITINTNGTCFLNRPFLQAIKTKLSYIDSPVENIIQVLREATKPLSLCRGINKSCLPSEEDSNLVKCGNFAHGCRVWHAREDTSISNSFVCNKCTNYNIKIRRKRKRNENSSDRQEKRFKTDDDLPVCSSSRKMNLVGKSYVRRSKVHLAHKLHKLKLSLMGQIVQLSAEQSKQMKQIVSILNETFPSEVENAVKCAAPSEDAAKSLMACWKEDTSLNNKAISADPLSVHNEDLRRKWSISTFRIALAVFIRCPAAYKALKRFEILHLTSLKGIESRTSKFVDDSCIDHKHLKAQSEKYKCLIKNRKSERKKLPLGKGVCIMEKIKVSRKVLWSSKSQEIVGLAVDRSQLVSLKDLFSDSTSQNLANKPAEYVLQFLWHDLTSEFNVIGPRYRVEQNLDANTILDCLLRSIRALDSYGFVTAALVSEGASENLKVLKILLCTGVISDKTEMSFVNPCRAGEKIYCLICPTYQMKNMISALHTSRSNGTKSFLKGGINFGWREIQSIMEREIERLENNETTWVPGLLDSATKHDSCRKITVKPDKIIQLQQSVLAELHAHTLKNPNDNSSKECLKYLTACSNIFENGLLSKNPIYSVDDQCLQNIQEGLSYFKNWSLEVKSRGVSVRSSMQKDMIAWQTWSLLLICVHGFLQFSKHFLTRHKGYWIVPVRDSGSEIGSLFS